MKHNPVQLTENDIREALLHRLLESATSSEAVIEELSVGPARVDVACAGEMLSGYEIKSDFDTLDRLARQMHAYHAVFDLLTIVTTSAYLHQVEALLPKWWGIWVAVRHGDQIVLNQRRPPASHGLQNPQSLAAMLWRDDAYHFATKMLGPVVRTRATRGDLHELIANNIPLNTIRQKVIHSLSNRLDLQARSHYASQNRAQRQRKVMISRVTPPSHEVAGF